MPIRCSELIKLIEEKYPKYLAEDYDNVGLLIGNEDTLVSKILVCLDINTEVIEEAIESGSNFIVSHHPLIFKAKKSITADDYISRLIIKLIRAEINVYSVHTNFDNAEDGMNDILADLLGLEDIQILDKSKSVPLYKIAVYVPVTHEDSVRDAMFNSGAGHIDNYSRCSFNIFGKGTFMPEEGSSPFLGVQGKQETVDEVKIEAIIKGDIINKVVKEVLDVHPYEVPAYDVYPLLNTYPAGTGRYGVLRNRILLEDFCILIKKKLNIPYLRVTGDLKKEIQSIAVIGGAGMDFFGAAIASECDVILTGDVKYHDAVDAFNMGLCVIDAGHYFTEIVALPYIAKTFEPVSGVEVVISKNNSNPFQLV